MKAYIATSGTVFGLVIVAHMLRVLQERDLARSAWFVLVTLFAAGLCGWAFRLLWNARR